MSTCERSSHDVYHLQLSIQDMGHFYAPRTTEAHPLDDPIPAHAVVPHQLDSQYYVSHQDLPPLCDDPTNPWFYVNDCRPTYQDPVYQAIFPQLLIRGTPCHTPQSLTPAGAHVVRKAEELANFYKDFEGVCGIVVALLAELYLARLTEAREVLARIKRYTRAIMDGAEHTASPTDFGSLHPNAPLNAFIDSVTTRLRTHFVGLTFYQDSAVAAGLKDPLALIDFDEYEQFSPGGGVFDDWALEEYEYIPGWEAIKDFCDVLSEDWYCSQLPEDRNSHSLDSPCYRRRRTRKASTLVDLPYPDYIVVRPPVSMAGHPLLVKPLGRWYTVYELVMKVATMCMLTDDDFVADFIRPHPQKYQTVRDRFADKEAADKGGSCAVCGRIEFDSYQEHVESRGHQKRYLAELNKLFRPRFIEGKDAEEVRLLKPSLTCLEYIRWVSAHFDRKVRLTRQLVQLADVLACSENLDYRMACRALTRACHSLNLPILLDGEDKPARASSPTTSTPDFQHWLGQIRDASIDSLELQCPDSLSEGLLDAVVRLLFHTELACSHLPLKYVRSLRETLAYWGSPHRAHLLDFHLTKLDVQNIYLAGTVDERQGLCTLAALSHNPDPSDDTPLILDGHDMFLLTSDVKDYEITGEAGPILQRLADFVTAALRDLLDISSLKGAGTQSMSPPRLALPRFSQSFTQPMLNDFPDYDAETSMLREQVEKVPPALANALLQEVEWFLDGTHEVSDFTDIEDSDLGGYDDDFIPSMKRSASEPLFSPQGGCIFANSIPGPLQVSPYAVSVLWAHDNICMKQGTHDESSDLSRACAIYSATIPSYLGPIEYTSALLDTCDLTIATTMAHTSDSVLPPSDTLLVGIAALTQARKTLLGLGMGVCPSVLESRTAERLTVT